MDRTSIFWKVNKVYRISDWLHYLGYTLLGSVLSKDIKINTFLQTSFLLAYAYSFNDYYDKKLKRKHFLIPLILSLITLPFLRIWEVVISLLFLLIFTLYSWPKIWLEGKPIISTLSNSIGFTLLLILPFPNVAYVLDYFLFILLIFILNTAAQLLHETVDFREDKKINKVTTAVRFGTKNSLILFKICLLAIVLISFLLFNNFPFISLSSSIFSLWFSLIREVKRRTRKMFKLLGIIVGVVYLLNLFSYHHISLFKK